MKDTKEADMDFSKDQRERYSRHIILDGVGESGQKKLLSSKVLIIGAGGLGAPVLMYLAASGVGTIGIVDDDAVELSNLQRQVIHGTPDVGIPKAESAENTVKRLNPDVRTIVYKERVTAGNICNIIREYDFIIDAVDNFATKFLINDACVLGKKPFCHAGVKGFQGQIMTYVPGQGPCYRCLFEEIPEEGEEDGISQKGILGTIPGILGSLQALEAQKYLIGRGELLTGRMLVFDGLGMRFRTVSIPENSEHCRVCGTAADITSLQEENYLLS